MSHHRLNNGALAERAFKGAEGRFGVEIAEPSSGYIGAPGIDNWLICQTLRREAEELFGIDRKKPPSTAPTTHPY